MSDPPSNHCASIIIPVWNGESVIAACLDALYTHRDATLCEVICVDNASADAGANLIATRFPEVRLLRQPVNLGFAGGVNAGIDAAAGDWFVLLNQDCLVHAGWLAGLARMFVLDPTAGILGCTILNADGTLNHAGAALDQPLAIGRHLTSMAGPSQAVDYVTGAAFALRRATWETVGRFDEDFYPAYYEETDYCYRAKRCGFSVLVAREAKVSHLSSSKEWMATPIKYWANQNQSRYRFVAKHFEADHLTAFFAAEWAASERELQIEFATARVLAARSVLRSLPGICTRRMQDLGLNSPSARTREIERGLVDVQSRSFRRAEQLLAQAYPPSPVERTIHQRILPAFDRLTGSNLAARAAHRGNTGGRVKLLELLAEYDYR